MIGLTCVNDGALLYDGSQYRLTHGIESGTADVRHIIVVGVPIFRKTGAGLRIIMDDIDAGNMGEGVDIIMVIGYRTAILKAEIPCESELACGVPHVIERFGSILQREVFFAEHSLR